MKAFKTLLILTLLLEEFRIPPTPAKELSAVYTTPMLARKPDVLLNWNGSACTIGCWQRSGDFFDRWWCFTTSHDARIELVVN